MRRGNSLSHTRWECKYHIVFIPKYRRKRLFGVIRKRKPGGHVVFRACARQSLEERDMEVS
jgi:putative transposase